MKKSKSKIQQNARTRFCYNFKNEICVIFELYFFDFGKILSNNFERKIVKIKYLNILDNSHVIKFICFKSLINECFMLNRCELNSLIRITWILNYCSMYIFVTATSGAWTNDQSATKFHVHANANQIGKSTENNIPESS